LIDLLLKKLAILVGGQIAPQIHYLRLTMAKQHNNVIGKNQLPANLPAYLGQLGYTAHQFLGMPEHQPNCLGTNHLPYLLATINQQMGSTVLFQSIHYAATCSNYGYSSICIYIK
jgi:hypothetical protein